MENLSKEILIEVKLQASELQQALPNIQAAIDKLSASQKNLEETGGKATQEYQAQASALRMLEQKYKDAVKYIDNVTSAGTANTNSLTQNKALLQALQQGYEAFGSHAKGSAEKVQELERTIQRQENVMKGTTKSAGDFSKNIIKAGADIVGAVPGGDQLNGILGSMGESFNSAKSAAMEAGEGMAASTAAAVESAGATLALKVAVSALTSWMETLGSVVPKTEQVMAGLKNMAAAFFNDIGHNVSFKELITDMGRAYDAAAKLEKRIQNLATANMQLEESTAETDRLIKKQTILFQNEKLSVAERKKASDDIYKNRRKELDAQRKNVDEEFATIELNAIKSKKLNKEQAQELLDQLKKLSITEIKNLELTNKIEAGTTEKMLEARKKRIKLLTDYDDVENDRTQRNTTLQQAADDKAEKQRQDREKSEQDYQARKKAAADQAAKEKAEAAAAEKSANEERTASLLRILEASMSAFSKELSNTDEHYRQLILKQQDFINKYNQMHGAQKQRNEKAYKAALAAIAQLQKEHFADRLRQIDEFNASVAQKVIDSNNELRNMQIENMENGLNHELALLDQQENEKLAKLKEQNDKVLAEQTRYAAEMDEITKRLWNPQPGDDKVALKKQLDALTNAAGSLLDVTNNYEKEKTLITAGFAKKRYEAEKKHGDDLMLDILSADALRKSVGVEAFKGDRALLDAKTKATAKQYDMQIEAAKAAGKETAKLEEEKNQALDALTAEFNQRRLDMAKAIATAISDKGFEIIKGSIKRKEEDQLHALSVAKDKDLQNTSLTSSQKAAIEERYRKQELAAKIKSFKAEQKASVIQAIINGALAMTKVAAQGGMLSFAFNPIIAAQTAASIATILAQKPPAYAQGGLHYVSNGQGSLLKGPGSGTSDSMNARVSNGESIINARSTAMFGDLLSAINVAGGGRPFFSSTGYAFASGGVAGNAYLPTRNSPARMSMPVMARPVIDYDQLASSMSKVNIAVDVKDVNNQQQILAKAINGSNY